MNDSKLSITTICIFFLCILTAVIHITQSDIILKLNGLGYLALLTLSFLPQARLNQYRMSAKQVLLLYTIVTIMMFFVIHHGQIEGLTTGLVTKAVEIGLASMLILDLQKVPKTNMAL